MALKLSLTLLLLTPLAHAQQDVSGQVIDATTGQPVPRALVRLGPRATLAGSDGHFFLQGVDTQTLSITAVKPGYSFTQFPNDPGDLTLSADQLATPITLRLYPDGLLKGTVTTNTGEPLANLDIVIQRAQQETYGQRWVFAAVARTNFHGQYRAPLPAGDYRIQSNFTNHAGQAVLPTHIPEQGAQPIHLRPTEQLSYDLHPTVSPLVEVTLRTAEADHISLLQIVPPDSPPFNIPNSPRLRLPVGSYTLRARRFGSDEVEEAQVNLAGPRPTPPLITLHTVIPATIPIQLVVDTSSPTGTSAAEQSNPTDPPNPRSLGLLLQPTQGTASADSAPIRPTGRISQGGLSPAFIAAPGTYRLRAQSTFFWYIRSASYSGTDLLTQDLLAAPGNSSTPITLVVSNALASLTGNVSLHGQPAACEIYLLAAFPSATPMISLRSHLDGTFALSKVPPGTYRAVAFESRQPINPEDPHSLDPYTTHLGSITFQASQQAALTLDAVPDSEVRR